MKQLKYTLARARYYEWKLEYSRRVIDYVNELEMRNIEMLEALIEINELAVCSDDRFSNYSDTIYIKTKAIIEKATEINIEHPTEEEK